MNPTEDHSNVQQSSAHFSNVLKNSSEDFNGLQNPTRHSSGFGRGQKYPGAEVPDPSSERGDHMIMEEAYALFEEQGERRSVRMIAEYCKNGELVCFYDSDDKRWHITEESIENKINKIKDLNARKATVPLRSIAEHYTEDPAPPPRPTEEAPPRRESTAPPSEDVEKMKKEILDLQILNSGKDYLIGQLKEDRANLLDRIENNSHRIGVLETRLLQLEAPRHHEATTPAPSDQAPTYRDVEDVPSSHTAPPVSDVPPDGTLSDNTNDNHEYSPQPPFVAEQT
jgi:hypothetical protein